VFVVDESSTVGYQTFDKVIRLIHDIAARLDIGTHADQVGGSDMLHFLLG